MALVIDKRCINCDMCEPECPNQAISMGESIYQINPELCTECLGHYSRPRCIDVCPVDCIAIDDENSESRQQLEEKFTRIQLKKKAQSS